MIILDSCAGPKNRPFLDVRRYKNRRYASPPLRERVPRRELLELKLAVIGQGRGSRWRHMIIAASVLVIHDHQERPVPSGASTDGLPDPEKELFAPPDITVFVRMLVIGAGMMGIKATDKLWFDK
jgi:hypothetical protein